jgi:hypothetical protein
MADRSLTIGDVLYILKNGFVHAEAEPATTYGFFKYLMECSTPNTNNRSVRIVVIPSPSKQEVKIITVMWVDEPYQG